MYAILLLVMILELLLPRSAGAQTVSPAAGKHEYLNGYALTGAARPGFEKFDQLTTSYMSLRHIPGGALAVTKNGRLVYARGYGFADQETGQLVQPNSLFRIASISKCFTSAAIMNLVQKGRLNLDDRVFDLLNLQPAEAVREDPRLKQITIRQLLQHTGGWDKEKSAGFDPMFFSDSIARSLKTTPPAKPCDIVRYMLARPLNSDPGTHYAYSNFGYCLLGRVIECVSGQSYEAFVQKQILFPCGIKDMQLGKTLLENAARGEVHYYQPDAGMHWSVFPGTGKLVPAPYGAWCLESMDSHGGWIGSVLDLVRFRASLDFPDRLPVLSRESLAEISRRPARPLWTENGKPLSYYYGLGWLVRPIKAGKNNYWHVGSLDGTFGLLVSRYDGLVWAVLFNQRSTDPSLPSDSIDRDLHLAADSVHNWPEDDLFPYYGFPALKAAKTTPVR